MNFALTAEGRALAAILMIDMAACVPEACTTMGTITTLIASPYFRRKGSGSPKDWRIPAFLKADRS